MRNIYPILLIMCTFGSHSFAADNVTRRQGQIGYAVELVDHNLPHMITARFGDIPINIDTGQCNGSNDAGITGLLIGITDDQPNKINISKGSASGETGCHAWLGFGNLELTLWQGDLDPNLMIPLHFPGSNGGSNGKEYSFPIPGWMLPEKVGLTPLPQKIVVQWALKGKGGNGQPVPFNKVPVISGGKPLNIDISKVMVITVSGPPTTVFLDDDSYRDWHLKPAPQGGYTCNGYGCNQSPEGPDPGGWTVGTY